MIRLILALHVFIFPYSLNGMDQEGKKLSKEVSRKLTNMIEHAKKEHDTSATKTKEPKKSFKKIKQFFCGCCINTK
jgi:hypothetical protein